LLPPGMVKIVQRRVAGKSEKEKLHLF